MITSLLDLVDAVNSDGGHVPPYAGKPFGEPDDEGGYGDGSGAKEQEAHGVGAVGLGGNHSLLASED